MNTKLSLFFLSLVLAILSVTLMQGYIVSQSKVQQIRCEAYKNSSTIIYIPEECK